MLKKVDIRCNKAFTLNGVTFSGYIRNILMSTEDIMKCLECKAKVAEILPNGNTVPLDFANYNDNHGGMVKSGVSESDRIHTQAPKVEVIGNKKFNHINKDMIKEESKPTNTSIGATVELKDTVKVKDKIVKK